MIPGENLLSARQVLARLAALRGNKFMHTSTLARAIREHDFPKHPNPFGKGWVFYWSDIEKWLAAIPGPTRRGPGRPRRV